MIRALNAVRPMVFAAALFVTACGPIVEYPYPKSYCFPRPERPYYVDCQTYLYSEDGKTVTVTRDMVTDMAQAEQVVLQNEAKHYASRFGLSSEEQGLKIARALRDFQAIQNRSDADLADFSMRVYGIKPTRIVAAIGAAQMGNPVPLNDLVEEAAKNFDTTPAKMKRIVQTLHGKVLLQQGIAF